MFTSSMAIAATREAARYELRSIISLEDFRNIWIAWEIAMLQPDSEFPGSSEADIAIQYPTDWQ